LNINVVAHVIDILDEVDILVDLNLPLAFHVWPIAADCDVVGVVN
jgi:hypothetical protein